MKTRNKVLIITGIITLVCSLIAFLIGGWLAGWDFKEYFQSSSFMWVMILVGVYITAIIGIMIKDMITKL